MSGTDRPRFYDLETADGVPYHQIALLHLDSLASTVVQACNYWGNSDQCGFCGIGFSLAAGRTIAKKTPADAGRGGGGGQGARRRRRRHADHRLVGGPGPGRAVRGPLRAGGQGGRRAAGGGAVRTAARSRRCSTRCTTWASTRSASTSRSFDPAVLARVAPGKFRTGIETYFRTWERAVALFGEGRVSTYVILGMGEDPDLTVAMCRRAVDIGVYPFVVPLRPVAGLADGGRAGAGAGVHRADLPQGRRLPGRARARRRHRGRRLCPLPGLLVAEPGAAGRIPAPCGPGGAPPRGPANRAPRSASAPPSGLHHA